MIVFRVEKLTSKKRVSFYHSVYNKLISPREGRQGESLLSPPGAANDGNYTISGERGRGAWYVKPDLSWNGDGE